MSETSTAQDDTASKVPTANTVYVPKMGDTTSSSVPSGFERWRQSLVNFTGLGMSREDVAAQEKKKGATFEQSQRQACLLWRNDLLRSSKSWMISVQCTNIALSSYIRSCCYVHG